MSAVLCAVLSDESGAVLAEYALVLALLSIPFMIGMKLVENATAQALLSVQGSMLNYGTRLGS